MRDNSTLQHFLPTTSLLAFALVFTLASCDKEDPRFANAPSIGARDITSHNASTIADSKNKLHPAEASNQHRVPHPPPLPPDVDRTQLPPDHLPVANNNDDHAQPTTQTSSPMGGAMVDAPANTFSSVDDYGKTGPLRWLAPSAWKAVRPSNSFRLAEYVVPGAGGTTSASLSVFHFPGGGGGIKANISRWLSQFTATANEKSSTDTISVNGLKVWRVHTGGQYNPGMMAGEGGVKEDYRLNAAIVETSAGPFFFKMIGPKPTVDAANADFDSMVQSFKAGE